MKNSRGQPLLDTFGALPGAQLMHTICRFEAREESNASNDAQFGVEMNKLEPLEADHTKLKANFAAAKSQGAIYEISLWLQNGDFQLAKFRSPSCMPVKST